MGCLPLLPYFSRFLWLFRVFCDPTEISGFFSVFAKNATGILIGIALKL